MRLSREWVACQVLPVMLTQAPSSAEAIHRSLDIAQAFLDAAADRTASEVNAAAGAVAIGPRPPSGS